MECIIAIAIIYFILKSIFSKKSKGSGSGVVVRSQSSGNKFKCENCGHDKFLNVSEFDYDGTDSSGRYTQIYYSY